MKTNITNRRFRRSWLIPALVLSMTGSLAPVTTSQAATLRASNCNDAGAGSLRAAITAAASGDTIDLTRLTCSRILLTSGQLVVPQNDLTIAGKGRFDLTIDGNRVGRVFSHRGVGTLHLDRMSVANGRVAVSDFGAAVGGCISANRLVLTRSRVHHCEAFSPGGLDTISAGGGIAVRSALISHSSVFSNASLGRGEGGGIDSDPGSVTLYRSQVYGNFASMGGGINSRGGVSATYSLIHGNGAAGEGGGIRVREGTLRLNKSTVSANRTDDSRESPVGTISIGGGLHVDMGVRTVIVSSTISGNSAAEAGAAVLDGADVYNSTVAFNQNGFYASGPSADCGLLAAFHTQSLRSYSSIFAKNTCPGGATTDVRGWPGIGGTDNLIGRADVPVPSDTIRTIEPRLLPLGNYGGPVRTHALRSDSPAINRGSNVLQQEFDQRGPGYPRVKGAFADIGAVEY